MKTQIPFYLLTLFLFACVISSEAAEIDTLQTKNYNKSQISDARRKGIDFYYEQMSHDTTKAEKAMLAGFTKYLNKDYKTAIGDFNRAIKLDSLYAYAFYDRGICELCLGDTVSAAADIRYASKIYPLFKEAYFGSANIEFFRKDFAGAVADYNEAINISPVYKEAYCGRGMAKMQLADLDGSMADINEAIDIDSTFAIAYFARGLTRHEKTDTPGAISDLSTAIRYDSTEPKYFVMRGYARAEVKQYKEADADLTYALNYDTVWSKGDFQVAEVYAERSHIRFALQRYKDALSDLNYVPLIDTSPGLLAYRSSIKVKLNDLKGAIADLNTSLKLNDKFVMAFQLRGYIYTVFKNFKNAVSDFERALSLATEEEKQYINTQIYLATIQMYEEASKNFDSDMRNNPRSATPYIGRALARLRNSHDYKGAITDYDQALILEPRNGYAYHYRGVAKFLLGYDVSGCADFKKSLECGYAGASEDLKKYCH